MTVCQSTTVMLFLLFEVGHLLSISSWLRCGGVRSPASWSAIRATSVFGYARLKQATKQALHTRLLRRYPAASGHSICVCVCVWMCECVCALGGKFVIVCVLWAPSSGLIAIKRGCYCINKFRIFNYRLHPSRYCLRRSLTNLRSSTNLSYIMSCLVL
jgi:hypothetical protein